MAQELRTNTATRITVGPFLDKTDGITPKVALTVTSEHLTFIVDTAGVPTLILDVAPTASGGANDMVHITGDDAGYYDLELAAADVNYLGRAKLSINDVATHLPVFHEFMIITQAEYDRKYSTGASVADVKTVVDDIHTDVGTAITNIGDVHATDLPAVKTDTAAIKVQTDKLAFTVANRVDANALQVGDKTGYAIGTGGIAAAAFAANAIDAAALGTDAAAEIVDKLLGRNIAGGSDGGRTVTSALRLLRNKRSIAGGTLTVTQEDDTTQAWTAAITTAAGNPVNSIDPA